MFWTMSAFYCTFCCYTNPVEVACEFFRNVGFASRWQAHSHNESGTVGHANCQDRETENKKCVCKYQLFCVQQKTQWILSLFGFQLVWIICQSKQCRLLSTYTCSVSTASEGIVTFPTLMRINVYLDIVKYYEIVFGNSDFISFTLFILTKESKKTIFNQILAQTFASVFLKWSDVWPSMVTHTLNLCSAFNPSKCTHTEWTQTHREHTPGAVCAYYSNYKMFLFSAFHQMKLIIPGYQALLNVCWLLINQDPQIRRDHVHGVPECSQFSAD